MEEISLTNFDATLTTVALVDEALELAKELERPLRYVQLNSFYGGSTGTVMRSLHLALTNRGVDSYILWGRRHDTINEHERCVATKLGYVSHGVMTRLFDRTGFYSKRDTAKLIRLLDEIDPDVMHLHNIHGYWINIEMLFDWLAEHRCQVRWTLHDCWAFTGHCAHFTYVKCAQWQCCCACLESCPQLDAYPKTICRRNCSRNFDDKRRIFTSVPPKRMKLITPSRWLKNLVMQSFLKDYPVEVRHNIVDTSIFRPTKSDFRERNDIGGRFMILGVASPWTERKGLSDFVRLANELGPDRYAVVLIGLAKGQIRNIPKCMVALERTSSPKELAEAYTAADVFFNPTTEDNYPTVNLEAEACGTPVVTYNTGGCAETITRSDSTAASGYESSLRAIVDLSRARLS